MSFTESYRQLRALAASMLFVSLVAGVIAQGAVSAPLASPGLARVRESTPVKFEFAIKGFESHDGMRMPPPGGTVFIGSSTFTKWKTLESEFEDCQAINRGFGGATIPDINFYADRIAIKYKPARIVFYAGTNDIADGHSAQTVFDDFQTFVRKVHTALPNTQIYFVSMSVPPSRLQYQAVYDLANRMIRDYVAHAPYVHYIDVTSVMRDGKGQLRSDYFLPDRLHMTRAGYEAWIPILRQALGLKDKSQP